jgi:hypothetical protein
VGCGYQHDERSFFVEDWENAYQQVGTCSKTSHPRGGYVEVFVSPEGHSAWLAGQELPEGTVFVKVQWDEDAKCTTGAQDLFTAMRKGAPGTAKDSADWEWQTVGGAGEVLSSNFQDPSCIACHTPCTGPPGLVCSSAPTPAGGTTP